MVYIPLTALTNRFKSEMVQDELGLFSRSAVGEMCYRKLNQGVGWKCIMEDLRLQSVSKTVVL